MPPFLKELFDNRRIPSDKRVLGPFVSAAVSLFLPGAAQAVNGQLVKGLALLLLWYGLASLSAAPVPLSLTVAARIIQYVVIVFASSDAYFIASRMKLGEDVRNWSVLFFKMELPRSGGRSAVSRGRKQRPVLITGAALIDGSGRPAVTADVLLQEGVIRFIRPHLERKEDAYTVVQGEGCLLLPGFINPCCCCEAAALGQSVETAALRQGFTSEVLGQNGQSAAPVRDENYFSAERPFVRAHGGSPAQTFSNTGLYLMNLERLPYPARLESMIGYGTLRTAVLGRDCGPVNETELSRLCNRVQSALASGARGISIGLAYAPCSLSEDDELAAVMTTAAKLRRLVTVQLPPGEGILLPALERIGRLAERSGARVLVTNFHAFGNDRRLGPRVCDLIASLRLRGVDISLAITGLDEQVCSLSALLPTHISLENGDKGRPAVEEESRYEKVLREIGGRLETVGGANAVRILELGPDPDGRKGQTFTEAAAARGCTPEKLVCSLLEENEGCVTVALKAEDSVFAADLFAQPFTFLCTDGIPAGWTDYTLPHFLGYYVKEMGVLSMEEAVRRNTMELAAMLDLWDRGLLREGMTADLVLLSSEQLPVHLSEGAARGIATVWVRGVPEYDTTSAAGLAGLHGTKFFGIEMGK